MEKLSYLSLCLSLHRFVLYSTSVEYINKIIAPEGELLAARSARCAQNYRTLAVLKGKSPTLVSYSAAFSSISKDDLCQHSAATQIQREHLGLKGKPTILLARRDSQTTQNRSNRRKIWR